MSKRIPYVLSLTILSLMLMSCEEKKKERPSPLRADSTNFKSGQLAVYFSSPAVTNPEGENRTGKIWGELVPYNQLWRTGANEASVFKTSLPIKISGISLDPGAYAIFTLPDTNEWKFILNKDWNQWGTYEYDSSLNKAVIPIVPKERKEFSERMKFYFENDSLIFHWENLRFSLPIESRE